MFSWMLRLVSLLSCLWVGQRSRSRAASREKSRFRPRLEVLEPRVVMSNFIWTGLAGDGLWSDPRNWSKDGTALAGIAGQGTYLKTTDPGYKNRLAPGAGDTVLFNNTSKLPTVKDAAKDAPIVLDAKYAAGNKEVSVKSLTLDNVPAGLTIDLQGAGLKITGNGKMTSGTIYSSTKKDLDLDGRFDWSGGVIGKAGSTIEVYLSSTMIVGSPPAGSALSVPDLKNATLLVGGRNQSTLSLTDSLLELSGQSKIESVGTIKLLDGTITGDIAPSTQQQSIVNDPGGLILAESLEGHCEIDVFVSNGGRIDVDGTLVMRGGMEDAGTIQLNVGLGGAGATPTKLLLASNIGFLESEKYSIFRNLTTYRAPGWTNLNDAVLQVVGVKGVPVWGLPTLKTVLETNGSLTIPKGIKLVTSECTVNVDGDVLTFGAGSSVNIGDGTTLEFARMIVDETGATYSGAVTIIDSSYEVLKIATPTLTKSASITLAGGSTLENLGSIVFQADTALYAESLLSDIQPNTLKTPEGFLVKPDNTGTTFIDPNLSTGKGSIPLKNMKLGKDTGFMFGGIKITAANIPLDATALVESAAISIPTDGFIDGSGSITGMTTVLNTGLVSPGFGNTLATLAVPNYSQVPGSGPGTLSLALANPSSNTNSDQLMVNGVAILGGTLNLNFINGFTPSITGQVYTLLTARQTHLKVNRIKGM
jgi:hypothetical protein